MSEIDVHGFKLYEAQEYIKNEIKKAYKQNVDSFKVIHGSNNGTKIKDWLRNSKTLGDEVLRIEPDLINSGATIIYLKRKIR